MAKIERSSQEICVCSLGHLGKFRPKMEKKSDGPPIA